MYLPTCTIHIVDCIVDCIVDRYRRCVLQQRVQLASNSYIGIPTVYQFVIQGGARACKHASTIQRTQRHTHTSQTVPSSHHDADGRLRPAFGRYVTRWRAAAAAACCFHGAVAGCAACMSEVTNPAAERHGGDACSLPAHSRPPPCRCAAPRRSGIAPSTTAATSSLSVNCASSMAAMAL